MTAEPDDAAAAAAEDAAFASGFTDKAPRKPDAKPAEKPADKTADTSAKVAEPPPAPVAPKVERPQYIRITRKQLESLESRIASHEGQFSKAFGTIGNLQKLVNGFQAQTPAGRKVKIPPEAFAQMERDFPELAQQTRGALEAALADLSGTGPTSADIDDEKLEAKLTARETKRELKTLDEDHPNWREIVGSVAQGQQPDAAHPFRRWLATKPAAYQAKLNDSESAAFIGSAIDLFQAETAARRPAAALNPRDAARAERIAGAVQPRGDNAGAAAGPSDDDAFLEGYNSR
jgi:hypothetical protein